MSPGEYKAVVHPRHSVVYQPLQELVPLSLGSSGPGRPDSGLDCLIRVIRQSTVLSLGLEGNGAGETLQALGGRDPTILKLACWESERRGNNSDSVKAFSLKTKAGFWP